MCGIVGFSSFHKEHSDAIAIVTTMCDAIDHRGPDEWNYKDLGQVVFGHRRLSIVGLSDGQQPMVDNFDFCTITFNGEIYNYKQLKQEMQNDGYQFRTASDTEVVLALYLKYGKRAFEKMNGMFALAIWDKRSQELVFARDRMGKKPFFYFYKNQEVIFASELKALVKHPRFTKRLSAKGLNKFLTFEYIPAPGTIFEDTYKVEAGEVIVISKTSIHKEFYWRYPSSQLEGESVATEEEAISTIDSLLHDAVKLRLQADVPVGVFLSGGIDSSLITAIACHENKAPVKSFSIYFNEDSYDESEYIDIIVKRFGLDHYSEYVSAQDMLSVVDKLGGIMDEPMADASLVPTYFVSKIAAKKMKTVLGGDGADEMFAGYPTYLANKLINIYNIIPYPVRTKMSQFLQSSSMLLKSSNKNMSLDFKLRQFVRGAGVASEIRFFKWMGGFSDQEKKSILSNSFNERLLGEFSYEDINRYLSRVNIHSELDRLLYLSQKMYMTDDILVKVDRASMMNSLEVRAPFLDYRLVEYAASLPERFKLKGFTSKYILKKLASKYLPKQIIDRPKKGFGIPLTEWLGAELKPMMLDLLSKEQIDRQGIFDYQGIKVLLDQHLGHQINHRKLLWSLISFQLWAKEFDL